ncbi:formyltetrahydrofolate deformylase [Thioflexithrix psekupsensis]|uniref:Formyltetrahydrofolate deformylase n=1 Tax=Thioflexithrix psekupsensis TaxID=1570016 RepID=A0A251X912_9GAMM|nr:formyltetrahydrofolate deformylase [Thioflexithrix psekupsensis]OUD14012.1 formyltetrahydrofolate deformylase [Thioflexithrix psekupsensis]
MRHTYRLNIACPDRVGIVAAVSQFLAHHGGWIVEANHHSDPATNWFFMRQEITAESVTVSLAELRQKFAPLAEEFQMQWRLVDAAVKKRVILMVSREAHCLTNLLYRWRSGEMYFDLACVISNHNDLRSYVEWHKVPYYHVSVNPENKTMAFAEVKRLFQDYNADTIVLARYMQILPPDICQEFSGRIINIHHSFLPSFIGAKPYHQAAARGVKLIGATCHYVTEELDAGPIIEQDVVRISHSHSIDDMIRLGADVETLVLARGLRYHLEDRVLVHGHKTIVFAQ